ncbi:MAG: phosphoglycerate mutase family protein [Bacteroidota bacterium]
MKNITLFFLILILNNSISAYAQSQTTLILLRHAEKSQDGTKDPSLSSEGHERAERLLDQFKLNDINAFYTTPYKRTRETILPLAQSKQRDVVEYRPFDKNLLKELLKEHQGETIMISGHSNTIPVYVNQLIGEEKFKQLNEDEYDKVFIVTLEELGKGKLLILSL